MKKALGGRACARQAGPAGSASHRESPSASRTQRRAGSCGIAYTVVPCWRFRAPSAARWQRVDGDAVGTTQVATFPVCARATDDDLRLVECALGHHEVEAGRQAPAAASKSTRPGAGEPSSRPRRGWGRRCPEQAHALTQARGEGQEGDQHHEYPAHRITVGGPPLHVNRIETRRAETGSGFSAVAAEASAKESSGGSARQGGRGRGVTSCPIR